MIQTALAFLADELATYLITRTAAVNGSVVVSPLVDDAGKWVLPENGVAATLVHVEEERVLKAQLPDSQYVAGRLVTRPPELTVNLHVLFCARFREYGSALKRLSDVLTFFQAHPHFTTQDFPALDPRLQRLSVDLLSPGYDQLNQLWAYLGAKHLPSALYRIRMVALHDEAPISIGLPILNVASKVSVK